MCCPLVFEFSVGIGGFVIGLGQISFFFSLYEYKFQRCKTTAYFAKKHKFSHKQIQREKHALIELCISIDIVFYAYEVIELLSGDKVLTFVLFPLFRFQEIAKA